MTLDELVKALAELRPSLPKGGDTEIIDTEDYPITQVEIVVHTQTTYLRID